MKAAHLAQTYNLPIANGAGWPIFNMHTMAGLMNGWLVEFHWGMWQAGAKFFVGAPGPENDRVKIPDAPGLGFSPTTTRWPNAASTRPTSWGLRVCRPMPRASPRCNGFSHPYPLGGVDIGAALFFRLPDKKYHDM